MAVGRSNGSCFSGLSSAGRTMLDSEAELNEERIDGQWYLGRFGINSELWQRADGWVV